jgi:Right handed beta helix region
LARARAIGALVAACLAVGGALTLGAGEARACDRWASSRGNDGNPGTAKRPYRSLQRLVGGLKAGQMGCLARGSTFTDRIVVIGTPRITIRSGHSRRARIRSSIRIEPGANGVRLASLIVQGRGDGVGGVIVIRASGARVVRSRINGLQSKDQSRPCILLDGAERTVIDGNVIHQCTRATTHNLYAAGIVALGAMHTTISNNIIHHTVGDAIALKGARESHLHHNLITSNVSGVSLSDNASANRIVNNVIANSGQHNVQSSVPPPVGLTNFVGDNCLWRGFAGNMRGVGSGFRAAGNRVGSPRFANRHHSFKVLPGPCYRKRPYGHVEAMHPRMLRKFVVRYRLLGLPGSVKIVGLGLMHVAHGARVTVRCVRGCHATRLAALRGRWLARGTVIEVRARRSGWIGHYAKVTVVGAPKGVRVDHACMPPTGTRPIPCSRYH